MGCRGMVEKMSEWNARYGGVLMGVVERRETAFNEPRCYKLCLRIWYRVQRML